MGRERCWKCQKIRNDVQLRSTDDRLCQPCFEKNEAELDAINRRHEAGDSATASTKASRRVSLTPVSTTAKRLQSTSPSASSSSLKRDGTITTTAAGDVTDTSSPTTLTAEHLQSEDSQHQEAQPAEHIGITETAVTAVTPLDEQISQLRSVIGEQQITISLLQTKLNFVLSYLGIDDPTPSLTANVLHESSNHADTVNAPTININNEGTESKSPLWTQVVKNRSKSQQHPQITSFQQSIVAAVYSDQQNKKRRESSLIVNGLQPVDNQTDKTLFTDLCNKEFEILPDIVSTKRIGRFQPAKIQPLLITLRQADQAQNLITNARQLRKSTDATVRNHVYINANLTRAEAEAAYKAREHRRHIANSRVDRHWQHNNNESSSDQPDTIISESTIEIEQAGMPPSSEAPPRTNDHKPIATGSGRQPDNQRPHC